MVIIDIVQYFINDEVCQEDYTKMNDGQTLFKTMKKVKTAAAGSLFTRGKILLHEEVIEHVRSRKKDIYDDTDRVVQKTAQKLHRKLLR